MSDVFTIEVYSAIGFEMEPVRLIEVDLTYGDQRSSVVLNYDTRMIKTQFTHDEKAGRTIGFRYTAYMQSNDRYMQSSAPSFTSPAGKTQAPTLVVDPRDLYRVERPQVVAVFPFQAYPAALVDVRATDRADGSTITTTLELNPERRAAGGALVTDRKAQVDLQYRVRHVAQAGTVLEGAWLPLEDAAIVVGEPALASIGSPLV